MEHFFTPIRRLQDWYDDAQISDEPLGYTEVQLAVSIDAFLNHRWDFRTFFTGGEGELWKVLWITQDACIWVEDQNNKLEPQLLENHVKQQASLTALSGETHVLFLASDFMNMSASVPTGASSIFWRAVTTSNCVKLKLDPGDGWLRGCSEAPLLQFWKRVRRLSV
jgi:hypothetical protein